MGMAAGPLPPETVVIGTLRRHSGLEPVLDAVETAGHAPEQQWLWTELALLGERWAPLRHPFYRAWAAGRIGARALALFASEYDHALAALALAARRAADLAETHTRPELEARLALAAAAAEGQLELWRRFAGTAGWSGLAAWCYAEDPFPDTLACAAAWTGGAERSLAEHLVAIHAIETMQARLAEPLRDGLAIAPAPLAEQGFFGLGAWHADAAALAEHTLRAIGASRDPFALLATAQTVHRAHWAMLDAICEHLGQRADAG
jgi:pyrroloquinoline quinone (PQQ) biosynthesis protein C